MGRTIVKDGKKSSGSVKVAKPSGQVVADTLAKADKDKSPKTGGTRIISCTCRSEFQDRTYGAGRRVHNLGPRTAGSNTRMARCTVCATEKVADL